LLATLVAAQDADYQQLQQRLEQLETEVRQLHDATQTNQSFNDLPPDDAGENVGVLPPAQDTTPTCFTEFPPCRQPAKKPPFPTVHLGGFFQIDSGWFSQDANNVATVGNVRNGTDFRRARLNAHGQAWDQVGYMAEFDFAFPGRPSFMDVYMDLQELPLLGKLRIGQWRQPFGMDGQTSVKELTFLERGLPFAFLPFRQIGVGFQDHAPGERMTWALSAFRFPTGRFGGNIGDSGGYAMATRVTFLPWYELEGSKLLHLGGGYVFGNPSNNRVRYRNQPEFSVSETGGGSLIPPGALTGVPPFVDTGPIPTQDFQLFGAEGGLVLGSLYAQSEAMYASVNQQGGPHLSFSGAYIYAGYFLTGEVRPYNRQAGVFGRVKPLCNFSSHGGHGAWELAGRWSYLDLNSDNIAGGRLNDVTLGMNWYLNPRTKFQFNYIHAFLDHPALGASDADIFALRGQVDF